MALSCPRCSHSIPVLESDDAQTRIIDLQNEVEYLNAQASSAVAQLARYEAEIHALRSYYVQLQQDKQQPEIPIQLEDPRVQAQGAPSTRPSGSRLPTLSSFLPGRKNTNNNRVQPQLDPLSLQQSTATLGLGISTPQHSQSSPNLTLGPERPKTSAGAGSGLTLIGLQSTLETERTLRRAAESDLHHAQSELEELTAQLFGQANEMVAEERKARAKLEERVALLETRDKEKRKRLERLEGALGRIERVRKMCESENEAEPEVTRSMAVPQVIVTA